MSSDIKDLLDTAADDSAQPMRHTVDDVVRRGRRGQRVRRIGAVAGSALAVAGVATAITVWPGQSEQPPVAGLGLPDSTVTVDAKSGEITQPGKIALSDAQVIARCQASDNQYRQSATKAGGGSESIDSWKVAVTQGSGSWFRAVLVSPDRQRYAYCLDNAGASGPKDDYQRQSVTADKPYVVWADGNGSRGVVPRGVAKIEFRTADGLTSPAVIKDGFFLWHSDRTTVGNPMAPIWAIFSDAQGREIARFDANPFQNDQVGVPGGKTVERRPIFAKR
ncbi:hypothetical protein ACQPXM_21560 [Kribbella sp. CA-253562]|uniref:hypothetical protein n=1 Tax=Kribbella sp. CA-253562 TaxID=3239942 RepID=UPI003D8FCAD8